MKDLPPAAIGGSAPNAGVHALACAMAWMMVACAPEPSPPPHTHPSDTATARPVARANRPGTANTPGPRDDPADLPTMLARLAANKGDALEKSLSSAGRTLAELPPAAGLEAIGSAGLPPRLASALAGKALQPWLQREGSETVLLAVLDKLPGGALRSGLITSIFMSMAEPMPTEFLRLFQYLEYAEDKAAVRPPRLRVADPRTDFYPALAMARDPMDISMLTRDTALGAGPFARQVKPGELAVWLDPDMLGTLDPELANSARDGILQYFSGASPGAVLVYLATTSREALTSETALNAARVAARNEGAAALDGIARIMEDSNDPASLRPLLNTGFVALLTADMEGGIQWLNRQPAGPTKWAATADLSFYLATIGEPDAARLWVSTITDIPARESAARRISAFIGEP
jgi:hypothetical protein